MMTVQDCIKYVEDHLEVRYATNNRAYQAGKKITPTGAVNHSIGVAQPSADVIYNRMNVSSVSWGVNAILGDFHIGEGKIILAMPYNARPWGCGQGKYGSWNSTKVQWEVCEPAGHTYAGGTMINYDVAKNQEFFDRMWKMLVCWNVYMVNKFGYDVSAISDHAEAHKLGYGSNHADMGHWLPKHGKSMNALRQEVQAILNNPNVGLTISPESPNVEEDEEMSPEKFEQLWLNYRATLQDNDASDYSEEARAWAKSNGLVQGGVDGTFNGMWEDVMTREQMITILYRFAKMMGMA